MQTCFVQSDLKWQRYFEVGDKLKFQGTEEVNRKLDEKNRNLETLGGQ
jgi:hypothetical protein